MLKLRRWEPNESWELELISEWEYYFCLNTRMWELQSGEYDMIVWTSEVVIYIIQDNK